MAGHTFRAVITVYVNKSDTGIHIAISTKVVGCALEINPLTSVEFRTVAEAGSIGILHPNRINKSQYIGCVFNTCYSNGTNLHFFSGGIYINVSAVYVLPTGYKLTVNETIKLIAGHSETVSVNSDETAEAHESISDRNNVVTCSFHYSSKINYGLTSLAVGSVSITFKVTSRRLVANSELCIMLVVRRRNSCKLGCYVDCAGEGGAVNNTVHNFALNVYNGLVTHICGSIRSIGYVVITVKRPNSYRNAYKSVAQSISVNRVFFNDNGEKLGNFIVIQRSLETVCNNNAVKLPCVCIVKLDLCYKLVYLSGISNIDVYIVDRLSLGSLTGFVMTGKLDRSSTCNGECAGKLCGVAKLILNLKCNCM